MDCDSILVAHTKRGREVRSEFRATITHSSVKEKKSQTPYLHMNKVVKNPELPLSCFL